MGGKNGLENGGRMGRGAGIYGSYNGRKGDGFLLGCKRIVVEPIRLSTTEEHLARLAREARERVRNQVVREKPVYLPSLKTPTP